MADHDLALRHDVPNSARVVNKLLGGKDNYEIDALVAAAAGRKFVASLREARRFLLRAVNVLSTEHGVHQYVDLGCGLPLSPDVGDATADRGETGRVLYLDHDILVAAHARALLENSPNRRFALVDITDTADVLNQISGFLDLGQPVAFCLSGTAELLPDATTMLAELTTGLPLGCWIIFSHITDDVFSEDIRETAAQLESHSITYRPRERTTVTNMLAPYRLLQPGLVAPHQWRPEIGSRVYRGLHPVELVLSAYAAVGHLPR
ncbi:SAM-dependent methyltransferase [Nocardia farcinica]|uniref:SAM-dependent methyltransferase n=1 Tax=Nocardia TaxID=1817 RepID=UPI000A388270|nr:MULTISPECIES: SAM-dependent methyltransferase [Nocardia]UAK33301.1 SAM-dependent methyltransferase [Nocardia asteroides]MBF6072789.1 SAM-dependent methyltransferase [Nocardia farcinica]MBF6253833.1 SAM-dependent methyltransferase [Nocardia farcinica]MBF6265356.1 SAM-dependent methyltransferase [Nocardia farcinica]MBF6271015.1 SAM-dependent methyltransferase [Nocardia farcinica]